MPFTTDFKAFAIGAGADVLSPGLYATQSWLLNGFAPGLADPQYVNTVWRQGSFIAAGIMQWMANTLQQNINDDGNLNNFVTLFGLSIQESTAGGVTSFNTRTGAVVLNSNDVITALGYTPVRSFNGRTGSVILNAADVNTALGYQPVKKSGDNMGGFLSGPDPLQLSHYATKNYVDQSITAGHSGSGNINGNATELNFPLSNGGLIKVGQFFPANGLTPNIEWLINFVTPFQNNCVYVKVQLVYSAPTNSTSPFMEFIVNVNFPISQTVNKNNFNFGAFGDWNNGAGASPPLGIIWTAFGF